MDRSPREMGLLSLPIELREQIYLYATQSHFTPARILFQSPPASPSDGQIYYPSEHAKWQPTPLLATSRQIRAEVQHHKATQQKLQTLFAGLTLHIRGTIPSPTWTSLPTTLSAGDELSTLHVNLILCTTEAFHPPSASSPIPSIACTLLSLLSRFLLHGPAFLDPAPPCRTRGPFFIGTLDVRLSFNDWYTRATWPQTVERVFAMCEALTKLDTAARYFGKIRVSMCREEAGGREEEWVVSKRVEEAGFREEEWAEEGLLFGESWFKELGLGSAA